MLNKYYKIQCDKHQFKPYEYCEMCMVRSELQSFIELIRKETKSTLMKTHLAISVLSDGFYKHEKQIKELTDAISERKESENK